MNNKTKIKVTAIAAGFTFATFVGMIVLVLKENPAQWYIAGVCIVAMCVTAFFGVTIED